MSKSTEILENLDVMHEKNVVQKFIKELINEKGLASYGEDEVRNNLIIGAVDTLLLSEDLVHMRKTFQCPGCGYETEITVKSQLQANNLKQKCPECGEFNLKEQDSIDLVDELMEKADEMNAKVEFISTETEEGTQLYRAFGGIAAILRYHIEY